MQGILFLHYKTLIELLQKLQKEDEFVLPCEHVELIASHEEKLKIIYSNYRDALKEVSLIVGQFDQHRQSIIRLKVRHRLCRKVMKKNKMA